MHREIIATYSEKLTKQIFTLCGQNVGFLKIKTAGWSKEKKSKYCNLEEETVEFLLQETCFGNGCEPVASEECMKSFWCVNRGTRRH